VIDLAHEQLPRARVLLLLGNVPKGRDRGAAYRQDGWTGYSPDAPAYSADEIARERSRYGGGEVRSFGDRDPLGGG